MPIKIGDADIDDVKLGGSQVDKIYLGETLLWQKASPPTYSGRTSFSWSGVGSRSFDLSQYVTGNNVQFTPISGVLRSGTNVARFSYSLTASGILTGTVLVVFRSASTTIQISFTSDGGTATQTIRLSASGIG